MWLFGRGEPRCDDVNGLRSSNFHGCRFYLLYYIYQLLVTSITLDTVVAVLIRLAEWPHPSVLSESRKLMSRSSEKASGHVWVIIEG